MALLVPRVTAVLITRESAWPADTQVDFNLFDEVLIETGCTGVHRRYELALQARNEDLYFQDDDCRVDARFLHRHYGGDRITHAITRGHLKIYEDLCSNRVTLIGWGSFFPKRLIDWSAWLRTYGEMPPSHEYDRVFTYLAWRQTGHHRSVTMPFQQLARPRAMSRDNPEHYTSRDRMIKLLEAL